MAYRNNDAMDSIVEKWTATKTAVYNFVADDNVSHTLWIVNDDNNH